MKKWFNNLPVEIQYLAVIIAYVVTFISLFVIAFRPAFSFFFIIELILDIIFTKWFLKTYYKKKKADKKTSKISKLTSKTINKPVETEDSAASKADSSFFDDVKIIDLDGSEKFVSRFSIINDGLCLYSEGGKTYHTHVNCFTNWKPEMRDNFDHWVVLNLEDAERKGLEKCRFCEYADLSPEDKLKRKVANRQYITIKLTGSASNEIQENIGCSSEFDDISIEYDIEKEKYAVVAQLFNVLGYLSASSQNKLKKVDELEELEGFILKIDVNDSGKYVVTIAVFID